MDLLRICFTHDGDSIKAMCRARRRLVDKKAVALEYAVTSIVLIAGSLIVGSSRGLGLLLILLSCWAFVALGNVADRQAKQIVEGLKGVFPSLRYSFYEDRVTVEFPTTTDEIPYPDIGGLYEDSQFFYLLLRSSAVYIIKKQAVPDKAALCSALAESAGLKWKKLRNSLQLSDIFRRL